MATINCTLERNSKYYQVYIEYSYTQNITANTSTITAALKLKQLTDSWDFDTVSAVTVGFNMAGETFSKTQRININDKGNTGYTITLASGTKTVTHDNSGNKTISFSCSNTSSLLDCSGYGPGSITLSSTSVKLKTIPRNAEIDKITNSSGTTIKSINVDNALRVYYTPTTSSYYHRLAFYVEDTKKKTVDLGKAGSTGQKYYNLSSVPASWLASLSTGTLKCYLYTYSDSAYGTKVGSTDSVSITVNVPETSAYMPTASLTITPTYNNNLNVYLKNVSSAEFVITGKAGSGASISSYKLTGSGVSSTKSSTTATLSVAGENLSYKGTVKDSRGRLGESTKKITVYNYSKPTFSNGRVTRCDSNGNISASGTYALGRISASISSVSGKNSISSLKWYYRKLGTDTWKSLGSISNNTNTKSSATFETTSAYQFKFVVQDAAGTSVSSGIYTMQASGRPLNLAKYNNGLAVGKLSAVTTNDSNASKFECAWPADFDEKITFGSSTKGSLYTDQNTSGTNIVYLLTGQNTSAGAGAGLAVHNTSVYVPSESNNGIVNLGSSGRKWNQVYAANSTISTSDKNKKKNIENMSDVQEQLFNRLKPVTYKLISGTSDRTHYGFISQDVEEALLDMGLTGQDFAGFCKDERVNDDGKNILDENGDIVYDYSLRYSEFIALNTYMIQKLQAENTELKTELEELREMISASSNKKV